MESSMYRKHILILTISVLLILTSCNAKEATISPESFKTQAAQTAEVAEALTAMAVSPTPSNTPTLEATNTSLLSPTPTGATLTRTPQVTNTPHASSGTACDNALYLNVQTPPDFSEIAAGSTFLV